MKYILFYSQPTIEKGKIVQGTTWYVSKNQGDGGKDFEYTKDATKAVPLGKAAMWKFKKTHGSRARYVEIQEDASEENT